MRFEVAKGVVLFNGGRYQAGSIFEADPLQLSKLVAEGFVLPAETDPPPQNASMAADKSQEPDGPNESDGDLIELPTPEEFESWKAPEQKRFLANAGIEPASNAEGRMEQFRELYESADEE